jgi:hypothetical protein
VLISELAPVLLSTPSKTLGLSRPCTEGSNCALDESAIALIAIIPKISTTAAHRVIRIEQLPHPV